MEIRVVGKEEDALPKRLPTAHSKKLAERHGAANFQVLQPFICIFLETNQDNILFKNLGKPKNMLRTMLPIALPNSYILIAKEGNPTK